MGTSLADILDDLQSGLALAGTVDQYLVRATCIDTGTPLGQGVIGVPIGTDTTLTVNTVVACDTIAIECRWIQLLVHTALIAVEVRTSGDLCGWLTT